MKSSIAKIAPIPGTGMGGGFTDWYLPSQDELEILYRVFKPTAKENSQWVRSGINLSALPPTRPYALDSPVQTAAPDFQGDNAEAFATAWYWSSTQYAADSVFAWCQHFFSGTQYGNHTARGLRARAVRRVAI